MDVRVGLIAQEGWVLKNWCFWNVVLEKTLESPLDSKEIKPVHPKGNQSWIFIGRTDAEGETPVLWPPDVKKWLTGKDPDAGTDWRQEEKGMTEDELVGWHHQLNGHEFEQALGVAYGQGSLACCSPWGLKESDMTVWLNWTEAQVEVLPHQCPYTHGAVCCAFYQLSSHWSHIKIDSSALQTENIISYFSGFLIKLKIFKCRGKDLDWSSF